MFSNPFKRSRRSDGETVGTSFDRDQVKVLEDKINQLNNERKSLIELNEKNLQEIRQTYEDQISKLRSDLKETSSAKSIGDDQLSDLQDELSRMEAVKEKMSNSIINLQRRCHVLEEGNSKMSENSKYQDLLHNNKLAERNLQEARRKITDLESQLKIVKNEMEFNKRIQTNLNKTSETSASILNSSHEQEIENLKKLHEIARDKLLAEFDNNYKVIDGKLKSATQELELLKDSSQKEIDAYKTEQRTLTYEMNFVRETLKDKEKLMKILENELDKYKSELAQIKSDKDQMEKLASEEIDMLKYQLNMNIKEVNKLMKEKQELAELPERTNRKRRRVDNDDADESIQLEARTKGNVSVGCQKSSGGKYCLFLRNVGNDDVDLNEWRLMFTGRYITGGEMEYAFAPRILKKEDTLNVWNEQDNVEDDEQNLSLNIEVPINQYLKCQLLNDMYEVEASFQMKE